MITRITFSTRPPQKRYSVGDTWMRGKTEYIKQCAIYRDPMYGVCGQSRRGKTVCGWVVKGSIRDQNHPDWKP